MRLAPEDKCTACAACSNACPLSCISFEENSFGERKPRINEAVCISCGRCSDVCPVEKTFPLSLPKACYAAWTTDRVKRLKCASGGLATVISEYCINSHNGVVVGVAYDDWFTARTVFVEDVAGLEKLKGSKYVQNIVGDDTFRKIQTLCESGRFVVYIALPCQIAGLKSFLKKDYENLVLIDLICHGVCPPKYWKEEIEYFKKKKRIRNVSDVRLRGNDGNNYCLTIWDGAILKYRSSWWDHNRYLIGFLKGITLQENCYQCPFARPQRISDITLGDFIGLGEVTVFPENEKNVSFVSANTEKGLRFYNSLLSDRSEIRSVSREYEERLRYAPSLLMPFPRHPLSKRFRMLYSRLGYKRSIRKTLMWYVLKERAWGLITASVRMVSRFNWVAKS